MWVLLSGLWLALGVDEYVERRLFHRAGLLAVIWGFVLIFWLYQLRRAFQRGSKG
jgi:hypothetical protein